MEERRKDQAGGAAAEVKFNPAPVASLLAKVSPPRGAVHPSTSLLLISLIFLRAFPQMQLGIYGPRDL